MKKKKISILLASAFIGMSLVGCSSEKVEEKPEKKEEAEAKTEIQYAEEQVANFYLPLPNSVYTMDVSKAQHVHELTINANVFETLFIRDKEGLVPGVAERVEANEDQTVFTFYLKEGAKWSNGDTVKASHYEFAIKRMLQPEIKNSLKGHFFDIENAEEVATDGSDLYGQTDKVGIVAIDDKTLEIRWDRKIALPLLKETVASPSYSPINKEFFEQVGADKYGTSPENTVFNGAFKIEAYVKGDYLKMVKNDHYRGSEEVILEEINYDLKELKEKSTTEAFEEGQFTRVHLASQDAEIYKDRDELTVHDSSVSYYLQFNFQNTDIIKNKNLRKALVLGLETERIIDDVFGIQSEQTNNIVPKGLASYSNGDAYYNGEYNDEPVEAAIPYFEKALEELGKEKITIQYAYYGDEVGRYLASELKSSWEKNIPNLTLELTEYADYNKMFADIFAGKSDFFYFGVQPGTSSPFEYLIPHQTGQPLNYQTYSNEEIDKLIEEGWDHPDYDTLLDAAREVERKLLEEEAVVIPLHHFNTTELKQTTFKGAYKPIIGHRIYKDAYFIKE